MSLGSYDNFMDKVIWEPDTATARCRRCRKEWGFIMIRRHHCRCCGELICDNCSVFDIVTHESKYLERVCFPCATLIYAIQLELVHLNNFLEQQSSENEKSSDCYEKDEFSTLLKGSTILRTVSVHISSPDSIKDRKLAAPTIVPSSDASQMVTITTPRKFHTKLVFTSPSLTGTDLFNDEANRDPEITAPMEVDLDTILTPQALRLQKSLDEMSDIQLEKLFKQLSTSDALAGIGLDDIENYPEIVFQEILANPSVYII